MNLKSDRSCITFIEPIFKYLSLFGVTPAYSFRKRRLIYPKLFVWYSTLLTSLITAFSVRLLYLRYKTIHPKMAPVLYILDVLHELSGLLLAVVTILGSSFWNLRTWQDLLKLIFCVENAVNVKTRDGKKCSVLKSANVLFIVGNVCLFSLYIRHLVPSSTFNRERTVQVYYGSVAVLSYFEFLLITVVFNIVLSVKDKYKAANNLLVCYKSRDILNDNLVKNVRKVKNLYSAINEILETFNKLFGWPLLLMFSHSVVQALVCFIYLSPASYKWIEIPADVVKNEIILVNLGYGFTSLAFPMAIIFCCDSAVKESDKLLASCQRLEQLWPSFSKEREELKNLKTVVKTKSPKFTAAGFFQINRSTFLSLLSTITTYFIVVMQFNSA